jgi:hypothetical protein
LHQLGLAQARSGEALKYSLLFLVAPLPLESQQAVSVGPNVWLSRAQPEMVQVEPVIAVDPSDPRRMVAAAIGLRQPHAADWQDRQTIMLYQSADGGASWTHRPIAALPDSWTAGDPWLAWSSGGTVILSAIAGEAITRRGEPPARARLFWSADAGWSWDRGGETPFRTHSSEDHPVLALGRSAGHEVGYVVATHATSAADGIDAVPFLPRGSEPLVPYRPQLSQVNLGGAVVTGDGALVVLYYSMSPPRSLWAARWDPVAGSWTAARIRADILPVGFPSLAVASTGRFAGRIYGAWVEGEDQGDMRVLVGRSDDGGRSWSEPVRAHGQTGADGRTLPVVAVAPDGAVAVAWQDRRNADGAECTDLYGAISADGAASFLPEVRISSETACPGDVSRNGAAQARFRIGGGDYQGLAATGAGSFQAVWSDGRTGRYQVWTAWLRLR